MNNLIEKIIAFGDVRCTGDGKAGDMILAEIVGDIIRQEPKHTILAISGVSDHGYANMDDELPPNRISTIRAIRKVTGMGLKDAVDIIRQGFMEVRDYSPEQIRLTIIELEYIQGVTCRLI